MIVFLPTVSFVCDFYSSFFLYIVTLTQTTSIACCVTWCTCYNCNNIVHLNMYVHVSLIVFIFCQLLILFCISLLSIVKEFLKNYIRGIHLTKMSYIHIYISYFNDINIVDTILY